MADVGFAVAALGALCVALSIADLILMRLDPPDQEER